MARLPTTLRGVPTIERAVDAVDKWLFLVVFATGALLIVGLKLLGFPQWFVTGAPVALIALYFFYVWLTPRFLLRDDHASDNLYYLGFLFTLVSLSIALYQFSSSDGRAGAALISNFGVALATTITGLALRVALLQMRQSPAEIERLARTELAKAATELRKQLDASVLEIELFRNKLLQRATDVIDFAASKTSESLETIVRQFGDAGQRILASVHESFEPIADHGRKLRTASGRIAKGVEEAATRVESLELPSDLISKRFASMLDPLEAGVVAHVNRLAELGRGHDKFASSIDGLRQSADSTGTTFASLRGELDRLGTEAKRIVEPLQEVGRLGTQSARAAEGMVAFDLALRETAAAARTASDMATASAESTAGLLTEFAGNTGAAAAALRTLEDGVRGHAEAVSQSATELQAVTLPAAGLTRDLAALAASLNPIVAHARDTAGTLDDLAVASRRVREFDEALRQHARAVAASVAQAESDFAILRRYRELLEAEVGRVSVALTASDHGVTSTDKARMSDDQADS